MWPIKVISEYQPIIGASLLFIWNLEQLFKNMLLTKLMQVAEGAGNEIFLS